MMFALSFVQSHNIVPHSHEDEHSREMQDEHESSHFEFSDEFTRFNLSGYNITFAQFTKELKNNLHLKISYSFSYLCIKYLPEDIPIQFCSKDKPDPTNPKILQVLTLRAPPFLIA